MKTDWTKIFDFCKVKNLGSALKNGDDATPRVQWICNWLDELGIPYALDSFLVAGRRYFNIILLTDVKEGVRVVSAHHDIVNPESDNANDNSASIINAINLKILLPEILVVLTDCEEFGGIGAARFAEQCNGGDWGQIDWILNLELTGAGGRDFFIGSAGANEALGQRVIDKFNPPLVGVPFNDSVIFRRFGLDSIVINPLPRLENGKLDMMRLFLCHSIEDSLDKISTEDMQVFVEEVLVPIMRD